MKLSKFQGNLGIFALTLLMMGTSLPAIGAKTSQLDTGNVQQSRNLLLARLRRFKFNRIQVKAPSGRFSTSGAVRGCSIDSKNQVSEDIVALMPAKLPSSGAKSSDDSSKPNVELTTSAYPTVLFYLPQNSTETATFSLRGFNEKGDEIPNRIYYSNIKLPPTKLQGGVVILDLDKTKVPELTVGKPYKWNITFCEKTRTVEISGLIRRVDPNKPLVLQLDANSLPGDVKPNTIIANELAKVNKTEHPFVYADNGIWYSAVSSMGKLLNNDPKNSNVRKNWEDLLSGNLPEVSKKPILGNAKITDVFLVNKQ